MEQADAWIKAHGRCSAKSRFRLQNCIKKLSNALAGLAARRGLWVRGEIREPKRFQCRVRGHRLFAASESVRYSRIASNSVAACASISRTKSMVSALGSSSLNLAMASAVAESCSISRTSSSCPASFREMSSLEILSAVPLPSASACALRSFAFRREEQDQ